MIGIGLANHLVTLLQPRAASGTQPSLDYTVGVSGATQTLNVPTFWSALSSEQELQELGEVTRKRYQVESGPEHPLTARMKLTITSSRVQGLQSALTGDWRIVETPQRTPRGWRAIVEAW